MSIPDLPDSLFELPESIDDPDLRLIYEILIVRLRSEAAHCKMSTVQELLLERIAYNYVLLRHREKQGASAGFTNAKYHKEFNTFWLAMTQEFDRMVRVNTKPDEELVERVGQALSSVLSRLHPDVADPLRQQFGAALAEVGL